jgi:hypothetical protein
MPSDIWALFNFQVDLDKTFKHKFCTASIWSIEVNCGANFRGNLCSCYPQARLSDGIRHGLMFSFTAKSTRYYM